MTSFLAVRNGTWPAEMTPKSSLDDGAIFRDDRRRREEMRTRPVDAYPREAWERLGQQLKQRRPQIDPRYRIRKVFATENDLTDKTVQEIENAYRDSFSPEMLSTIERAYRLPIGEIKRFLHGGEFEPFRPVLRISQVAFEAPAPGDRTGSVTISGGTGPDVTITADTDDAGAENALAALGELSEQERVVLAFGAPLAARVAAIVGLRRGLAAVQAAKDRKSSAGVSPSARKPGSA